MVVFECGGLILCGLCEGWGWMGGILVDFGLKWVKSGGLKMGQKWGFGLGVGAFSENGGFWGFRGYKSSSVFGGKIGDFGLNLVGRGILGVGVI